VTAYKQTYKNRSEAFREFIQPQRLPISERTFYNAASKLGMVQTDKTIRLADLVAYANDLKPPTDQPTPPGDLERLKRLDQLELEEKEAKVKKLQMDNRKEDRKWIQREDSELQRAALVGLIYDTIKHHLHLEERRILQAVGADADRLAELGVALEEVVDVAFNEIAGQKVVDVEFLED
jgi:hypothetical protein